jgi:hypothetical protein
MAMGVNVKVAFGLAAVCGVLLLSGCGGSSSATASAGWNPPRPSGVPDDKWASVSDVDPASLPVEDLSRGYCHAVKPSATEVDAKTKEYPGATVEELNAYYDYVFAYVAPLCAGLPPVIGTKGLAAKKVSDL